jgi:hypothetical protein
MGGKVDNVSQVVFGIFWGALGASAWWSVAVFGMQPWNMLVGLLHSGVTCAALLVWFLAENA